MKAQLSVCGCLHCQVAGILMVRQPCLPAEQCLMQLCTWWQWCWHATNSLACCSPVSNSNCLLPATVRHDCSSNAKRLSLAHVQEDCCCFLSFCHIDRKTVLASSRFVILIPRNVSLVLCLQNIACIACMTCIARCGSWLSTAPEPSRPAASRSTTEQLVIAVQNERYRVKWATGDTPNCMTVLQ